MEFKVTDKINAKDKEIIFQGLLEYNLARLKAEEEARGRRCKYVFLDTFSFQAPEFYKKHGYKEKFVLEEYPLEGKRHYFTKRL